MLKNILFSKVLTWSPSSVSQYPWTKTTMIWAFYYMQIILTEYFFKIERGKKKVTEAFFVNENTAPT